MFPTNITCARTRPIADVAACSALADPVARLLAAQPQATAFLKPRRLRDPLDIDRMLFFGRQLVPVRLADGSAYFLYRAEQHPGKSGDSPVGFGGSYQLNGLDDPLVEPIWRAAVESRSFHGSITLSLRPMAWFEYLYMHLCLHVPKGRVRPQARLQINFWPRADVPTGIRELIGVLGLEPHAGRADLSPREIRYANQSFMIVLDPVPLSSEFVTGFMDRVAALPGVDPAKVRSSDISVGQNEPHYSPHRERFNEITSDWNQEIRSYRDPQFDPYRAPTSWADRFEPELRFPVAQRLDEKADVSKNLSFQVDVVHTPAGSFLEMMTHHGQVRLRRYAGLAEIDLEFWDGPLVNRWDDPAANPSGRV